MQLSLDGSIVLDFISCPSPTASGIPLAPGMHTLILSSDSTGCVDTADITVRCFPETLLNFSDTVFFNQTNVFCIDDSLLAGGIDTLYNACPEKSGDIVDLFLVGDGSTCVVYESGEQTGVEEACIIICNAEGQCGTVFITVTVLPEPIVTFLDTIGLNETDTFCIDTSMLDGTIVSIENTCPEESGEAIVFEILDSLFCISYTGFEVGMEMACIRVCDDNDECFTTEIIVTVEDERLTFEETILLDSVGIFCPDTTLLSGNITTVTNTCPEEGGGFVEFTIDSLNCLRYEGLMVGTGNACLELCDDTDECVTIDVTINVEEDSLKAPNAVPDRDTVQQAQMSVLNPLGNDTLCSDSIVLTIAAMPPNGTATVNPDGTITYIPMVEFCDDEDVFLYQVCNEAGCDTARVMIFVECSVIEIFPGLSPNGDGVNDTFVIDGLEGFPNHVLQVFDRRGTRVLNATNYQSDWGGTWEGKDLPDGIYFYVLDDGFGGRFSGYLNLRR